MLQAVYGPKFRVDFWKEPKSKKLIIFNIEIIDKDQ